SMGVRKLATIRTAGEITPIAGAEAIECCHVDGWTCVIKKGEFKQGDRGVYFEIDSFIKEDNDRYPMLSKQVIDYEGQRGTRLRTARLRGQLSQGLFLPMDRFPELASNQVGDDVTEILGITKWEPPISTNLSGEILGEFPTFISKTDQERVQNLIPQIEENKGQKFEVTVKLDGSSMTVYRKDDHIGVCGRNWELRETATNAQWHAARRNKMIEGLQFLNRNLALQGEIIGESIQGNLEKLKGQDFYLFDIYDIDKAQYLTPIERQSLVKQLNDNGFTVKHVPILDDLELNHTAEQILAMADGPSLNKNVKREGLVFKRLDGKFSFKAISNAYLEKHKDR
uniref:Naegleria gruberi RNA ligase n=1 Tax=Naegleria gruberi TaxID=5762 RepID=UPI0006DBD7DC|nr:Chain A, Naegleria gruberi RNA ligase [Naegleria gruberi]6VTF_A Chain A, RNA ligase [Naegleria gruberi]6VTF_B Chain B, RNA ligase [Naegleria gruberi]6VTF_C Chain C, RNA ligase [Naegleria gruberi]6VTF_D Chain D, RNA ligase [Naegleria gruberi]